MSAKAIRVDRVKRLLKEGFWVILGNIAVVVGMLVGVRILTGFLDPIAYGQLALGMTAATLGNQFIFGPLSNGITRFYAPAAEQNDLSGYFSASRKISIRAIMVTILIMFFILSILLIAKKEEWISLSIFAFIFAIASGCNAILNGMQNAARQRSIVALHQGGDSWLRFLMAAGLILALGASSTNAMAGYALASSMITVSQWVFFKKKLAKNIIKTGRKNEPNWGDSIWRFSWPFSAWGIFTWAQMASSRWCLELFSNTHEVGLYAVLFQLGYYPIATITVIAMQFLAPIFYQRAGDGFDNRRNIHVHNISWRLTGIVFGATIFAFLIGVKWHSDIFRIFASEQYRTISYLFPWMLLSGGIFAAGQTIALNLMSQMKTYTMMGAKIGTAVLGVILNFMGAFLFGTRGVVAASLLFSLLYFIWMLHLSGKAINTAGIASGD